MNELAKALAIDYQYPHDLVGALGGAFAQQVQYGNYEMQQQSMRAMQQYVPPLPRKCKIPDHFLTESEIRDILSKCNFRKAMKDVEFRECD